MRTIDEAETWIRQRALELRAQRAIMVGERFGLLAVEKPLFDERRFQCRCQCGAEVMRTVAYLLNVRVCACHDCTLRIRQLEIANGGTDFWADYLSLHPEAKW